KKYLLAVSGGIDSMCMAELFLNCSLRPDFAIAHVNFSLRGEESDADERLTRSWAEKNGIHYHCIRFDTNAFALEKSLSIEMAARELRYGWFESLIEEFGYDFLSVAHNRNDSVETFFLNILRGTGIDGITGIRKYNGKIIRPLIEIERKDIFSYVSSRTIIYRDDRSNFENEYSRNKIRNLAFPIFETINPSFLDTVSRDMEHFSQAAAILDDISQEIKKKVVSYENGATVIDMRALKETAHTDFHAFHILNPFGFNSSQIKEITDTTSTGKHFSSPKYDLITDRNSLRLYPTEREIPSSVTINGPGTFRFGDFELHLAVTLVVSDFNVHPPHGTLYFDATKLEFPIVCRTWQEADRFHPFGMKGSRKISDFFTTLKLDRIAKKQQPIICDASDRIICIPPFR
ncbi:MAG: tRNA lysidine(34) synthetase TilS, partial [Alistipes sp.]|nr:tRNA lysidine(34) synthetase TilS [Candidatus Minthomonas equi]